MAARRTLASLAVAGVVPALMIASAGTALASPKSDLSKAKQHARHAIDVRLQTLANDVRRVDRSASITAAHRDTLVGFIQTDLTGLRALRDKINADTTVADVKADAAHIYADYRVYALLNPQIGTVLRGDSEASQASRLLGSIATTTGKNSYRQAQLDHARALLNNAENAAGAAESTVLGFTPAQVTDGVTPVAVVEARSSLSAVADDIAAARNLIHAVRDSNDNS